MASAYPKLAQKNNTIAQCHSLATFGGPQEALSMMMPKQRRHEREPGGQSPSRRLAPNGRRRVSCQEWALTVVCQL